MLPVIDEPKRKRYLSNMPTTMAPEISDLIHQAYSTVPDTTIDFAPGKIRISKVRSQISNNVDSNKDLQTPNLSNQNKTLVPINEPYSNNLISTETKPSVMKQLI
jgi:hypothetical protein